MVKYFLNGSTHENWREDNRDNFGSWKADRWLVSDLADPKDWIQNQWWGSYKITHIAHTHTHTHTHTHAHIHTHTLISGISTPAPKGEGLKVGQQVDSVLRLPPVPAQLGTSAHHLPGPLVSGEGKNEGSGLGDSWHTHMMKAKADTLNAKFLLPPFRAQDAHVFTLQPGLAKKEEKKTKQGICQWQM